MLSKSAKARMKRMNMAELKALEKAARMLADAECITSSKYAAIYRWCGAYQGKKR